MSEREDLVEVLAVLLVLGQVLDQFLALFGDVLHAVEVWGAQVLANQFDLVLGVGAWQEGLSLQHFGEDAADTPHVDGSGVVVGTEKQFGSSVPPCGYVLSEHVGLEVVEEGSGQSEVADLEVTIGIDQKVAGFLNGRRSTRSRWTIWAEWMYLSPLRSW